MIDPNDEIAVRQARMDAAKARPDRKGKTSLVVAGMAAGSGAKLVAAQHRSRVALEVITDRGAKARAAGERRCDRCHWLPCRCR